MSDPVADAIARGDAVARRLIEHRDAVIEHLTVVYAITGPDGLRACAAGAAEAVIIAAERHRLGAQEGEILPFPPLAAGVRP